MLIAGAGIGTGMLTLPYAIKHIGAFGTIYALILAYIATAIINIYIADLALKSNGATEMLGIVKKQLPEGKVKKVLAVIFFLIIAVILLQDMIIYILCASDILVELFGIPELTAKLIFYFLASGVILLGVKGIGVSEKYSVSLIMIAVLILTTIALVNPQRMISFSFGEPKIVVAVYGLFMFAFSSFFSTIQVANNIEKVEELKKAMFCGLSINSAVTLLFAFAAITGSKVVTEVATIGIASSYGITWIRILCSALVLFAVVSSFWSVGRAFTDMVKEQINANEKVSWVVSTIPVLIIAIFFPMSVLKYVQIGAGILSIALGIMIIPAYYNLTKKFEEELLLGKIARSKLLMLFECIAMIVMAISSFITIS
jgi:amino acid permease